MQIEFTEEERGLLLEELTEAMGTLREQVYHADTPGFRDGLERRKEVLGRVLEKVCRSEARAILEGREVTVPELPGRRSA